MICDRRVRIIRVWLLLIAIPFLWPLFGFWTFYAATLIAFGLMMPVFVADCGTASGACSAGTKPSTASATVSGYASASCNGTGPDNCTALNVTYTLPYVADASDRCRFQDFRTLLNCTAQSVIDPDCLIVFNATHMQVQFLLFNTGHGASSQWDTGSTLGASPLDCSAFGTLSLTLNSDGLSTICSGAPTSVTVVFS